MVGWVAGRENAGGTVDARVRLTVASTGPLGFPPGRSGADAPVHPTVSGGHLLRWRLRITDLAFSLNMPS